MDGRRGFSLIMAKKLRKKAGAFLEGDVPLAILHPWGWIREKVPKKWADKPSVVAWARARDDLSDFEKNALSRGFAVMRRYGLGGVDDVRNLSYAELRKVYNCEEKTAKFIATVFRRAPPVDVRIRALNFLIAEGKGSIRRPITEEEVKGQLGRMAKKIAWDLDPLGIQELKRDSRVRRFLKGLGFYPGLQEDFLRALDKELDRLPEFMKNYPPG